jgi:two-component system nitrogen regulation response regulator GlnG
VAAIPNELIESELFGHEKGAFTGATQRRMGRFEQADHGTLFLDEIGDMPSSAQTRLLRVLAENEFYRVGGHQSVQVDVRIIAATHQNLETLVERGTFREDLFHRLNVIRVHVPALSERREDIPLLAQHFLDNAAIELGDESKRLDAATSEYLSLLPWPGNVRQLENTCRWLQVMASSRVILIEDLPPELQQNVEGKTNSDWESGLELWVGQLLDDANGIPVLDVAMPRFERVIINAALRKSSGRKKDAAELLGWGRNTLTRKMQELDY